jgi:hypothetical protein
MAEGFKFVIKELLLGPKGSTGEENVVATMSGPFLELSFMF